jgi:hypothetical protein
VKLALVVALLAAACGGAAKPTEPLHQTGGHDRLTIAAVELRGVSERHRVAVTAIAGTHLVVGAALTLELSESAHEAILDYYYERGFINVVVRWAEELERARGQVPVVLTIDEGALFRIASLEIKDVPEADRVRYIALSPNRPGETFVRSKIAAWVQAVGEAAPGKPIVVPETSVDLVANTIVVTLALKNP